MRIVGGTKKGRRLVAFKCTSIRPTSDRVREAVFNVLGQDMTSRRVLDLFAGTGAMGIEALSRGAAAAVFVDRDARAVEVIKRNIEICGLKDRARVVRRDAKAACRMLGEEKERFDIVFIDAPYREPDLAVEVLKRLADTGLVTAGGTAVLEVSKSFALEDTVGFEVLKEKRYGDTLVYFLKAR